MASNFRIVSYKFEGSIYLKLTGDFDEDSVNELVNTLKKYNKDSGTIFIDTNDLKTIHPFDKEVFQKNLDDIKIQLKNIIIIGINKNKIAPN